MRSTMKRELLINASPRETRVAILEDDELVELLVDRPEARRMVGDIYLGRVEAVLPGIQAAFVDIGTEKSAFLHASDLVFPEDEGDRDDDDDEAEDDSREEKEDARPSRRAKAPPIQDLLKRGQDIVVQVSKEPISTKGPRVTAQISLAGRFLETGQSANVSGSRCRSCCRRIRAGSSCGRSARTSPKIRSSER